MPCLGPVTVAVLSWVIGRLEKGERIAIASVIEAQGSVPGKPGARLAVSSGGDAFGTVGGAGLELKVELSLREMLSEEDYSRKKGGKIEVFMLHKDGKGKEVTALDSLCGGRVTVSMEVIDPVPHILIAGGGHVGESLGVVCDSLGWKHSVFDVREEYSNRERFPDSNEVFSGSVSDFLTNEDRESLTRFSDILLLGHDWSIDEEMMIGLLQIRNELSRPRIGAIGSKTKWASFRKAAINSGIPETRVDSVRCPIGLDIGADSPEEIAVAVCAEVLSLERGVRSS